MAVEDHANANHANQEDVQADLSVDTDTRRSAVTAAQSNVSAESASRLNVQRNATGDTSENTTNTNAEHFADVNVVNLFHATRSAPTESNISTDMDALEDASANHAR